MTFRLLCCALVLLVRPDDVFGASCREVDVYYINGAGQGAEKTKGEAKNSVDRLQEVIAEDVPPDCPVPSVILAYNPSDGLPNDLLEARAQVTAGISLDAAVLQEHVALYRASIAADRRVIIVAHSQGNLYANAAFEALVAANVDVSDMFAIVAVASPASFVAGYGYPC